ncbi:MAG TPA: hypothetical protein VM369_06750 [Candidatus Binatia bacterium]|nr:hypothetical protein [Candidatus Binatia bacterium]
MMPIKYLLGGLAVVSIASVAWVMQQPAGDAGATPVAMETPQAGPPGSSTGPGAATENDLAAAGPAGSGTGPAIEGVPPLLAAPVGASQATPGNPVWRAQRDARRAASPSYHPMNAAEREQRRALRDKWRQLSPDQRRAVRAQCDAKGLDRHSNECLKLAANAASYPVPPRPARGDTARQRLAPTRG